MVMSEAQSIENALIKITIKTAFAIALAIAGCAWVCASYMSGIMNTQDLILAKIDKGNVEFFYQVKEIKAQISEINTRANVNSEDITKLNNRVYSLESRKNN